MGSFEGKNIIITGASSGIGRITAIYLSRLGANLALIARNEKELIQTASLCREASSKYIDQSQYRIYQYDLNRSEGLDNLTKQIVSDMGLISGLVYSAGMAPMRPLKMTKPDSWREPMQLNTFSFVEIMRVLSKKRFISDGASVVVLSSTAALKGAKSQLIYSSTKAGLEAVVRCISKELISKKIRLNALRPTFVRTNMYEEYKKSWKENGQSEKELFPQGIVEPEQVAAMIAFLLGDESKTIVGTCINIDNGRLL